MNLIGNKNLIIVSWALFSILIAIFLLRGMLWEPGLPYTRDLIFPNNLSFTYSHLLSTWNDLLSQRNLEINKIPVFFLFAIGSYLSSSEYVIKVFFITVLFLSSFVIYVSIFLIFKDRVKSIWKLAIICGVPSLLYLLNPWTVDRISNHIFVVFGMALNPLLLILYIQLLKRGRKFLEYLLPVLVLTLISIGSTHDIFYMIPILGFVTFFYIIMSPTNSCRRKILFSAVFFLSLYLLLNSFWILPIIYESYVNPIKPSYSISSINNEIERLSKLNTPANIFQLIGGGGWNTVVQSLPFSTDLGIKVSFFIPIFSLFALILFPRNKFIILLGFLFIIAYFLSLGNNSPLPVYKWLSESSPFSSSIWVFRDPTRLIQFIALIYSIFLAFTLFRILSVKQRDHKKT